jgi:hypothetical protein
MARSTTAHNRQVKDALKKPAHVHAKSYSPAAPPPIRRSHRTFSTRADTPAPAAPTNSYRARWDPSGSKAVRALAANKVRDATPKPAYTTLLAVSRRRVFSARCINATFT